MCQAANRHHPGLRRRKRKQMGNCLENPNISVAAVHGSGMGGPEQAPSSLPHLDSTKTARWICLPTLVQSTCCCCGRPQATRVTQCPSTCLHRALSAPRPPTQPKKACAATRTWGKPKPKQQRTGPRQGRSLAGPRAAETLLFFPVRSRTGIPSPSNFVDPRNSSSPRPLLAHLFVRQWQRARRLRLRRRAR